MYLIFNYHQYFVSKINLLFQYVFSILLIVDQHLHLHLPDASVNQQQIQDFFAQHERSPDVSCSR